ncbi:hypothetical protein [Streptomyces sp. NPDC059009]|uniref:hypothetical protein n=1 Tax=Streptomyces sp. NPDC059009 TaxID=3346694 RepID=UPI0036CAB84F
MTKLLLSVHVLVAILAVGSITVAASMFPRYAVRAAGADDGDGRSAGIAALLHRVCRGYAVAGLAVPVFGLATAVQLGVLGDAWLIASLVLTAVAAALLGLGVLPAQERLLSRAGSGQEGKAEPSATAEAGTTSQPGAAPRPGATAEPVALRPLAARLAMLTGIFNVLWAVVVVLMIVRPGSTTGA